MRVLEASVLEYGDLAGLVIEIHVLKVVVISRACARGRVMNEERAEVIVLGGGAGARPAA